MGHIIIFKNIIRIQHEFVDRIKGHCLASLGGNSNLRGRFVYPFLKLMLDSFFIAYFLVQVFE